MIELVCVLGMLYLFLFVIMFLACFVAPVTVYMNGLLQQHRCSSLFEALNSSLPFKIPVLSSNLVQNVSRRENFVIATSESNYAVEGWLQHFLSGNSEMSVMALDGLWIFIIENWTSVSVYFDQSHASSVYRTRPDATLMKNGAVVLKHEAKATATELNNADDESVDKLFSDAFSQFPMVSNEIVGIHRLFYNTESE